MVAVDVVVTLALAVSVMVPPAVFGAAACAACAVCVCAIWLGVCAVKVMLANGLLGADGVALLATLMMVVVPCPAAWAAWAMLVFNVAVLGATRFTTLTAGVIVAVPVLALILVTAGVDTLAAFAVTLLLATVAATAVAACAAWALAAT